MVFVPYDLTYDGLMKTVEDIVMFDSSRLNIGLRAIMTTSERHDIVLIKNDRDVSFLIILEEASEESTSDDEDGVHLTEFETNTDHGLDDLDEQYLFVEDDIFGDFIREDYNQDGVNCGRPSFDGEGDSGCDFDVSDDSYASGQGDEDGISNTTTRMSSSPVPRLWIKTRSREILIPNQQH
ncbi:hypothetical protein Q3G72_005839 [Acer saccharum]|nr:hypothetical protein Q3G72_005839 [Acer saccharum]